MMWVSSSDCNAPTLAQTLQYLKNVLVSIELFSLHNINSQKEAKLATLVAKRDV